MSPRPLLLALVTALSVHAQTEPFRDLSLPIDRRVQDLVGRLTLEEKAVALDHRGPTIARFGIAEDNWNQCLHGVSWDGGATTLFPIPTGLAATWDPTLVKQVADAISTEARAINNAWKDHPETFKGTRKGLIYRAPVINILRNPYWGRNNEAWSEDPFLCGRMGVAFVQGLQGDDPRHLKLAATLKHYAVNNVEQKRQSLDAKAPERWLREYWLPHFRDAVVEGKAQSLMASYNAINGTPNNVNRWLLTDVLKGEWKHEGFVVSDLGGVDTMVKGHEKGAMSYVDAVAKSVMAGTDFSDKEYRLNIPEAVRSGKLSAERLDDAVRRVLTVRFRLGEFDPKEKVAYRAIPATQIASAEHRALSLEASRKSIALLENRGLLPLDAAKLKRVVVMGPLANIPVAGDPSYIGRFPRRLTSIVQGLRDRLPQAEVVFAKGAYADPKMKDVKPEPGHSRAEAVALAKTADIAILCVGTVLANEHEGIDRPTLALPGNQQELVDAVLAANPRTVVVLCNAGPLTVPAIQEKAPAILAAWWSGEEQGHAVADVLLGATNPAGRLPYTVYASEAQVPPRDVYDISQGFTYMYLKGQPLWAFGHGLSYTKFAYSQLKLPTGTPTLGQPQTLTVEVKNVGDRDGEEVVQAYVGGHGPVVRPHRQLVAFQRVALKAGESKVVSLTYKPDTFATWNESAHRFTLFPGEEKVEVGASSGDIRLTGTLTIR
jgi:beta-glucosidase